MSTKSKIVVGIYFVFFIAFTSFAGWDSTGKTVTSMWVGPYNFEGQRDHVVFQTNDSKMYYFPLDGSNGSKAMAATMQTAVAAGKTIFISTNGTVQGSWMRIDFIRIDK